jgi:hypothetical protein
MRTYKYRIASALLCMTFLVIGSIPAVGQQEHTRNVKLSRGQTPLMIDGRMDKGSYDNYVTRLRAGQKLTVRITSEDNSVYFMVIPTKNRGRVFNSPQESTEWSGAVPRTGDYMVHVGSVKAEAGYRLELSLQ